MGEGSTGEGPTRAQRAAYKSDGFVILERWLPPEQVTELREHLARMFDRQWETGVAPDEVNIPDDRGGRPRTRQLCNSWKADRAVARVVLAERVGRFAAELEGVAGVRILQDNVLWKPPGGAAIGAHRDAAYQEHLVPPNMTTCWMALDDTRADTGTIYYVRGSHRWPRDVAGRGEFHAPDDWLAAARAVAPPGDPVEVVPVEVPAGGCAFHHGWTFHGSPPNERADAERRSVVSHLARHDTAHHPTLRDPIYSRYLRPGSTELDESFFPIVWAEGGGRTPWLDGYLMG